MLIPEAASTVKQVVTALIYGCNLQLGISPSFGTL